MSSSEGAGTPSSGLLSGGLVEVVSPLSEPTWLTTSPAEETGGLVRRMSWTAVVLTRGKASDNCSLVTGKQCWKKNAWIDEWVNAGVISYFLHMARELSAMATHFHDTHKGCRQALQTHQAASLLGEPGSGTICCCFSTLGAPSTATAIPWVVESWQNEIKWHLRYPRAFNYAHYCWISPDTEEKKALSNLRQWEGAQPDWVPVLALPEASPGTLARSTRATDLKVA